MKLPFYIARRYVFSKNNTNVINIISGISVFGIAVSTMAMVLVLSGFNGIEHVIEELYSAFDSDIKITLRRGKTFDPAQFPASKLIELEGVEGGSFIIEETTILKENGRWVLAEMKGVQPSFLEMNQVADFVVKGYDLLEYDGQPYAIMGGGLLAQLSTGIPENEVLNPLNTVKVVGLLGDDKLSQKREDALNEMHVSLAGEFRVNPKYDDSYFLVDIAFAAAVLEYEQEVTGFELGLQLGEDQSAMKEEIQSILGSDYLVQDKFDQNALLFNTHKSEKWMTFLILCFIFVLATFNMIASLTMLVLDKRKDMYTLTALGADQPTIRKVFIAEGLIINFLGATIGILLGLLVAYLQIEFGWVSMGSNAIVDAFPVRIVWRDLLWILVAVLLVGMVSTYLPVRYLLRKPVTAP